LPLIYTKCAGASAHCGREGKKEKEKKRKRREEKRGKKREKERGRERLEERGRERKRRERTRRGEKETYECDILLDIAIKGKIYLFK
jgi:hypothetical protein